MGTLLPADATRDKRSMLITQVAALEGWCRCQSLGIWRQTPCKDLLGRQPGHARRSPIIEARAVWSSLTPNSRIKSAHKTKGKNPTRPAHRDAVPPARPARAAATALARPLPLATPSRSHNGQHPGPCAQASRSRAQFTGVHHGAAPVRVSVSSLSSPPGQMRTCRVIGHTNEHSQCTSFLPSDASG